MCLIREKLFQSAYDTIQIYEHQIWCFSVLSLRYCKPDSVKFIAEMGHKQSGLRTMEYSLDVEKLIKKRSRSTASFQYRS